jgi:hypothetical protein
MNKRIKHLYKQAHITREKQVRVGGWDNDREPFEYRTVTETNFDPEKFAELIVRECDRYARSAWEHGPLLGKDLLIHFGIEEPDDGHFKS